MIFTGKTYSMLKNCKKEYTLSKFYFRAIYLAKKLNLLANILR